MAKTNIMIVEDDAITAMDIENQLKQLGYGVSAKVSHVEDAIQKAKENTPNLVLMDIILKGEMDGIEAADQIHTQFDIPVVFLTAFADRKRLKRAKLINPFGFILKPFQDKDLQVTIEMAIYIAQVDAERKQVEEALQHSELWMRSIFKSLEETVLVVAPDRKIVNINEAGERMFGYSKDELAKQSTDVLHVDQEHYIEFGRQIKEAFDRGEAANFEFKLKRKNGEVFPAEHTVSLLKNDAGESIGIVSIVRDITERKQREE